MKKIKKGDLEDEIQVLHNRLLTAANRLADQERTAPNVVQGVSIQHAIGIIAQWEEIVTHGLKEIQRDKKPTDFFYSLGDHKGFIDEIVTMNEYETWEAIQIQLEDGFFQLGDQIAQFSQSNLNEPKRYRWLGSQPIYLFIREHTILYINQWLPAIEAYCNQHGTKG